MNPEDITLNNLAEYTAYLITEFYSGNLQPFFDSLDKNVVWCGALYRQFMHGKDEVLRTFGENPQNIRYSVGPIYTETIPHGKNQCDTISFFERTAYYEDGPDILWHTCFHLSWVRNDVWQMSVIQLSPKADRDDRDKIYQTHPLAQLPVSLAIAGQYDRIIFKEKDTGNSLYLSPLSIEWIEGHGHYSTVHYGDSAYTVTDSIKEIMEKSENMLLQCHSGFIVNPYYVLGAGRFFLRLSNGKKIPVPEKKYTAVRERLHDMLVNTEHRSRVEGL